jgi:transposase
MARDDRPFGGTDPPAVAYTYASGRGAVHLHTLLRDYRGIVQCDGYAPYKQLPGDAVTLAFCWAHVRRGFFEIARKGNAPIATQALLRIAALYRIGGIGRERAGGSVIPSQSRHENFSRTCSTIFQRRGSHSSVFDTTSPSVRRRRHHS